MTRPIDARTVVVTHRPGPVLPLPAETGDELDDLLDDLFPVDDGGPGLFDALLVGGGAALTAWSVLGPGPSGAALVGLLAIALGLVLPLRAVVRHARAGWTERRVRRLVADGTLLVVADPQVARMVELHGELATRVGDDRGDRAFTAAHAALVETAAILDGRGSPGSHDRPRIARLTEAVADLHHAHEHGATRSRALEDARAELDTVDRHQTLRRIQETIDDL